MLCLCCATSNAAAQSVYEGDGLPLPAEEEIRWLLNRARFDRARENARRGTSYTDIPMRSGPLAPNAALNRSARRHCEDLARSNRFQHETVPGSLYYHAATQKHPWDRMKAEGFDWSLAGENIAAGHTSGLSVYLAWWKSGGHRRNMGNEGFREIGSGHFYRASSAYLDYYVMNLGRSGSESFFTDTLFQDANHNGAYNQGEGRSGLRVLLLAQNAVHGHCDVTTVTGSFAVPLQGIADAAVVSVVIENTTAQSVSLHLPRDASTLEPLVLGPSESRLWGRFVHGARNAGFRDLEPAPYFLTVTPGSREHAAEGTSAATLAIDSSTSWSALSNAPWLRVTLGGEGQGAGALTYAVDPHDFGDPRSAAILFTSTEHLTSIFTITQSGVPAELQVSAETPIFPAAGRQGISLPVAANVTWRAASAAHWIQVPSQSMTGSGSLLFNVTPNAGSLPRASKISVSGGGMTRELVIQQEAGGRPTVSQHVVLDLAEGVGHVRTIAGIPPGLVWDKVSGLLRGQPSRAGVYTIQVEVRAADGSLSKRTLTLRVEELPAFALGTFEARFQQHAEVADGLGGETRFTTTQSGVLTGVVRVKGRSWSFRHRLAFDEAEGMRWTRDFHHPGQPSALKLTAVLGADHLLSGGARAGAVEVELQGWRRAWNAADPPADLSLKGRFHVLGEVAEPWRGDEFVPQGRACAVLTTTAAGRTVWTGRLGDGTVFTRSGGLGPAGRSGFWLPAYRGTGSVLWQGALAGARRFQGEATWLKGGTQPKTARAYRHGFGLDARGLVTLELTGEAWTPPSPGQSLAGMMSLQGLPHEWSLSFDGGVKNDTGFTPLDRFLGLGHDSKFMLPAPGQPGNENRMRLRVNARTGWLQGSFVLVDAAPDQPGATLTRTVSMQGLLLSDSRLAGGYFIAIKRPDPLSDPPRTRFNSDRVSGAMRLQVIETR